MSSGTDISSKLVELGDIRSKKRAAAEQQIELLEKVFNEFKAEIDNKPLADSVTQEPLVVVAWSVVERGASVVVSALDKKYGFSLEVYFEHGGTLATGVRGGADNDTDQFYARVFRGTPLRLKEENERIVTVVRHDQNAKELAVPALVFLSNFISAVSLRETHGV
jgi:hypothetical protein